MFLDPRRFEFADRLEQGWREIQREALALREDDFFPWYDQGAYSGEWSVCGVHAGDHEEGHRLSQDVVRRCPYTVELVQRIPGLKLAAFSRLGPGTIIHPHADGGPRALRCHLGLTVPKGCTFQVAEAVASWEEGRCLLFDTHVVHAAWNSSQERRLVLIVEVDPATWNA